MLLRTGACKSHGQDVARTASVSTCTDWSQGDRPIIWPGKSALTFDQDLGLLPNTRAIERDLMSSDPCLQALQAFVHHVWVAIWSSIVAAGVPGRGLYLNE